MLTSIITFFLFFLGIAYDATPWIQAIPVAMAILGALILDLSWRGMALVPGVTLLMYLVYCLRHFGPYQAPILISVKSRTPIYNARYK